MNTFHLRILASDQMFFEGACENLVAPCADGSFGVQANHSNMISAVTPGVLHYRPAEGPTDCRVPQAPPQEGQPTGQRQAARPTYSGVRRPARSGGQDQMAGGQRPNLLHRHRVVSHHPDVRANAPHQLVQVVGKAVVVVNEQNHRSLSFWASSRARTTAWALLMHS